MKTGDGAYIKSINRGLILREIIKHQSVSRAQLSKITGLNKATISVQVADLLKEKLIYETEQVHNVVGRRPIMLSINRKVGYVLGVDLDYKHIQYTVSDLGGYPVFSQAIELDTDDYDEIVQLLIKDIHEFQYKWSESYYGLISVMIGIHGSVYNDETINFVPTYQWQHKNIKEDLAKELDIKVSIENNANLSAYAEKVYQHHSSNHLLAIILTSGIGTGIIIDGKLHKGFHGIAGEMGHMIISPNGKKCRCGNKGCWELYAAEPVLIEQIAKKVKKPNVTSLDIQSLIHQQDESTLSEIKTYLKNLSIGLNNVINLYNPETLVLTSEILQMYPESIEVIEKNLTSSIGQYRKIVVSELGSKSCVMGACALAIQRFLKVPELIITLDEENIFSN